MSYLKKFGVIAVGVLFHTSSFANDHVDDLAKAFMQANQVEGMSIAVISKNKIALLNYGFADSANKVPASNQTIYTIASFTKTYTALLAAVASVEGKLDLDASFSHYFPGLINSKNLLNITSKQLLGHVSSFPFDFTPRPQTFEAAMDDLKGFLPEYAPGSEYSYSNAGIGTAGYVLQNIYAKNYQFILQDKVLKPLNMESTFLIVPAEKEKYLAVGHDQSNAIVNYDKKIEVWFAAASLKSTISDMAKYLNAHINSNENDTLAKAIKLVHQNDYCFADELSCEQLAWQAHRLAELKNSTGDTYFINFDKNGMPVFGKKEIINTNFLEKEQVFIDKTGSGYGMSSYMAYIPEEKTGVVILLNKTIGDERIKLGRDILMSVR